MVNMGIRLSTWSSAVFPLSILIAFSGLAAGSTDARLIDAVQKGDHNIVRELLRDHADVNETQPDGSTALILAADRNDLESANLLIRAGANVNVRNEYGATPLFAACAVGNMAIVNLLLEVKADPNIALLSGETPLMTAVETGNADLARALLERGADVNAKETKAGQTALMWAVADKHPQIVKLLVEHGADISTRSKAGFTPLLFAAQQGSADSVRALLEAGADVNETRQRDGLSALIVATRVATASSRNEVAVLLLDKGADPNKVDGAGYTALHYAAGCGPQGGLTPCQDELSDQKRAELVNALLAHGANPNARITQKGRRGSDSGVSLSGATPIFFAAASGHIGVVSALTAGGADPFAMTDAKTTPLHLAAGVGPPMAKDWIEEQKKNQLEITKFLVNLGADVNAVGEHRWTPLHGAAYKGIDSVVQFLVEKGAKMDVFDEFGQTPLSIASSAITVGVRDYYDLSPRILRPTTRDLLLKLGAKSLADSGVKIQELFYKQP